MSFGYNIDVVEDMCWFDDHFHHFRVDRHVSTFFDIQDTENFQVQLWLRESCILNIICVNVVTILDIFADNTDVWQGCDSVESNNKTLMINSNEVNRETRFSVLKGAVEVSNMFTWIHHDLVGITATHWYNNLFSKWVFGYHINPGLGFVQYIEDWLVDLFGLLVRVFWEIFLDFKNNINVLQWDLSIRQFWSLCYLSNFARYILSVKFWFCQDFFQWPWEKLGFQKVYIFSDLASLRVNSIGYSWPQAIYCHLSSVLVGFISSYQTVSIAFFAISINCFTTF